MKIFDFGVLSVTLTLPVRDMPWEGYVETALALAAEPGLANAAREAAVAVFDRIRPAVSRPGLADLVEEYCLWHVGEFDPALTGADLLSRVPRGMARLLTLERSEFSEAAVAEILRSPIRYSIA